LSIYVCTTANKASDAVSSQSLLLFAKTNGSALVSAPGGGAHGSHNKQSLRRYQKSGTSFPVLRIFLLTNTNMRLKMSEKRTADLDDLAMSTTFKIRDSYVDILKFMVYGYKKWKPSTTLRLKAKVCDVACKAAD
jgi:hypothetical protein